MDLEGFHALATGHPGVRRTTREGVSRWQVQGRLVARELDATHVAVRVPFDVRDLLLRQHPGAFSVPPRMVRHMMVVLDLVAGDDVAAEAAVTAAWQLQTDPRARAGDEENAGRSDG